MANYGLKVSRVGYDVKTADPDELVFSSKYKTLRVKQQGSGTVTESGGRTVTIAHNLGYVPMFLVHGSGDTGFGASSSNYYINPYTPVITGGEYLRRQVRSYADSTNLYITLGNDFGWKYAGTEREENNYGFESDPGYNVGGCAVGRDDDNNWGSEDGALRFNGVAVSSSVYKAELAFYIDARLGSGDVKTVIYGIDEDDTNDFGSSPFGRDRTSNSNTETCDSGISAGDTWAVTVTSIFNEIVGRGGWSSGNNMGFLYIDNSTENQNDIYINHEDDGGFYESWSHLRWLTSNTLLNYKYTIFYNQIE